MRFREKPIIRGVGAEDVHDSRTPVVISSPAYAKSPVDSTYQFTKNSVLVVILLVTLAVIGFMLFNLIATPEFLVKHGIESIANDYYENYFYPSIPDPQALNYYKDRGLATVSLKQLLLYSDRKNADSMDFFSEYCDLTKTYIRIFPESPYGSKNYHIDYTYSCKF